MLPRSSPSYPTPGCCCTQHRIPVPSQPTLRPFDIAVSLRLVLVPGEKYEPLANALATSTSAVHRSVARLQHSGFCATGSRQVNKDSLQEFLLHGLRYVFPPVHGSDRVGIPTAGAHPAIAAAMGEHAGPPLVWASEGGTTRAQSLMPLFAGMTRVVQRDTRMHELLAMVDLLRVVSPAGRQAASNLVSQKLAAF